MSQYDTYMSYFMYMRYVCVPTLHQVKFPLIPQTFL